MKTKKYLICAAAAAALCLTLTGCSLFAHDNEKDNTVADADAQLEIIAENKALWLDSSDYGIFSYTVTDLDHNGRLEIIASTCQGTGLFSYNRIFEINEAKDGLQECTVNTQEGESLADIVTDSCACYCNEGSGLYRYIFTDLIRFSAGNYSEDIRAVTFTDGTVTENSLACKTTAYTEGGESVTYNVSDGSEITAEDYENAAAEAFAGLKKSDVALSWLSDEETDLTDTDTAGLAALLGECYNVFAQ